MIKLRLQVVCEFAFICRRHPERSRYSGGAKDPARGIHTARQIPRPAGESAGRRDDVRVKVQSDALRVATVPLLNSRGSRK